MVVEVQTQQCWEAIAIKLAASKTALGLHFILLSQTILTIATETYSQRFFLNFQKRLAAIGIFLCFCEELYFADNSGLMDREKNRFIIQ